MTRRLFVLFCACAALLTSGCSSMGYPVGFWDYMTFLFMAAVAVAFIVVFVVILELPGRIAVARRHPEADAVKLMGLVGFMAIVPWIQALIWAFKPTDVVDIRYFPSQEAAEINRMMAKMAGKTVPNQAQEPSKPDQDREKFLDNDKRE